MEVQGVIQVNYGDWKVRDHSKCWNSENVILYPSTNSVDEGSINLESNLRNIVRRITRKNYVLREGDFSVTLSDDNKSVVISPGEANIQGYHLIVNKSITLDIPNTVDIKQWTLGISLSYDGANNVTGDIISYGTSDANAKIFTGAYVYFFDKCQILNNYENVLILGRVWEQNGKLVTPGTKIPSDLQSEDTSDNGRIIEKPLEIDPFKYNEIYANKVEINLTGCKVTPYDTLPENISVVYDKFDSMLHPINQDRNSSDKPPTMSLNLQQYIDYTADWYTNKYGDAMSGALRFDQLSIDRKIELDPDNGSKYVKDSSAWNGDKVAKFSSTEGAIISPRGLGKLTARPSAASSAPNYDLTAGGTLMTVVPRSYLNDGIDTSVQAGVGNAIYAALTSTQNKRTGLQVHSNSTGHSFVGHTKGYTPTTVDNKESLLLENVPHQLTDKSTLLFDGGDICLDCYGIGKVIQLFSKSEQSSAPAVAFRFGQTQFNVVSQTYEQHQMGETTVRSHAITGLLSDTTYLSGGISSSYNYSASDIHDPYLQIGNLRLKSNTVNDTISGAPDSLDARLNTLEVASSITDVPYIRVWPGIYTTKYISEEYVQVGSRRSDDVFREDAHEQTKNKIVMGREGVNDSDAESYAFFDLDVPAQATESVGKSQTLVRICKAKQVNTIPVYEAINGVYSYGDIGCSDKVYTPEITTKGRTEDDGAYQPENEWVRFTRYRYDHDNDTQFGGAIGGGNPSNSHEMTFGDTYNIEFNTTVANRRANQIIWKYKGAADETAQPLTLSYVHDTKTQPNGTKYPDEEYYDHNLYKHKNPTYGIRDFLRIDGGGLSIHGDLNNPTITGDSNNKIDRLGVTMIQGRVYSGIYNDYAETYEKDDVTETSVEGMLVELVPTSGKYRITTSANSRLVVGVISHNYGMLLGGKTIEGTDDIIDKDLQTDFFAVGVAGKIPVNVVGKVEPGDLLVSSEIKGLAKADNNAKPGTIIGKALSTSQLSKNGENNRCLMQIMLA